MVACNNCYFFDQIKLHANVGFFKARKHMVIFILNVLLKIEKLYFDFCECEDEKICYPCQFRENLYLHMCQLFERKKQHFFPPIL